MKRTVLRLHFTDKRSKAFTTTELTNITGIGEKTANKLLTEFGSVTKVKEATEEQLKKAVGLSATKKILAFYEKK